MRVCARGTVCMFVWHSCRLPLHWSLLCFGLLCSLLLQAPLQGLQHLAHAPVELGHHIAIQAGAGFLVEFLGRRQGLVGHRVRQIEEKASGLVALDEVSRMQQVHDGCFASIEEVPRTAITLTVPALMRAASIFCVVPGINKAMAVGHTINADISALYPSTALRLHENARLYLDEKSALLLTSLDND